MSDNVLSHETVVSHIFEFLDSCGYQHTLQALQAESGIPYNTIHTETEFPFSTSGPSSDFPARSRANFENAVLQGKWPEVLRVYVEGLLIPSDTKFRLYEQIFYEMLLVHSLPTAARALLLNAPIFAEMRASASLHMSHLDAALSSFSPDDPRLPQRVAELKAKREELLRQLSACVSFVDGPQSEVLSAALLEYLSGSPTAPAAKRQKLEEGGALAGAPRFEADGPAVPQAVMLSLADANEESRVVCAAMLSFGGDGDSGRGPFVLQGYSNGELAVLDARQGGIACTTSSRHPAGVFCLTLESSLEGSSAEQQWAAVGYRDGSVKIYAVAATPSLSLLRKLPMACEQGVTSVDFGGHVNVEQLGGHRSAVVAGSFDGSVSVFSILDGSRLFHVRDAHWGHSVDSVCCLSAASDDRFYMISSGKQGVVRLWRFHERDTGETLQPSSCSTSVRVDQLEKSVPEGTRVRLQRIGDRQALTDSAQVVRNEVLVTMQSHAALVVQITCGVSASGGIENEFCVSPLCVFSAPTLKQFTGSCAFTLHCSLATGSTTAPPVLSVFYSTADGAVVHYKCPMKWRDQAEWEASKSSCLRISTEHELSNLIPQTIGARVADLSLSCASQAYRKPFHLCAFSAEVHRVFVL